MPQIAGPFPEMPKGTEVASFSSYQDASEAIERLSEADFPVGSVTIVGSDLHLVEDVVGRLTPARVALAGATQGITWGLLFGLMLFMMLGSSAGYFPVLGIIGGILLGIIFSVISWASSRRKRSFVARTNLVASRYAILVTEQTDRAFKVLQGMQSGPIRPRPTRSRPRVNIESDSAGPDSRGSGDSNETPKTQSVVKPPDEPVNDSVPEFGVRLTPEERREREENQGS
jgi:hypothetical protein